MRRRVHRRSKSVRSGRCEPHFSGTHARSTGPATPDPSPTRSIAFAQSLSRIIDQSARRLSAEVLPERRSWVTSKLTF